MIRPSIPERLVQAAVQAGLDVVRQPPSTADRLACLIATADEWEDQENEPAPPDHRGPRRLRPGVAVVGFDSLSAEGMGNVPWFAD